MKRLFLLFLVLTCTYRPLTAQTNAIFDNTFATDGYLEFKSASDDFASSLDIEKQSNGKSVVLSMVYLQDVFSNAFSVDRFLVNGQPDLSFGDGGKFRFLRDSFETTIRFIHVLPDDKILIASSQSNYFNDRAFFTLIRLNADGTPDDSFGNGGKVEYDNSIIPKTYTFGSALLANKGLLVSLITQENQSLTLIRFLADGSLDPAFGTGGILTPDSENLPVEPYTEVAPMLLPDGNFLLYGFGELLAFYVNKFSADGTPQSDFGNNGLVTIRLNQAPIPAFMGTPLLDNQGRLTLTCYSFVTFDDEIGKSFLTRVLEDGSFDVTFGTGGYKVLNIPNVSASVITKMYTQTDGSILGSGAALVDIDDDGFIALFKLKENGDLSTDFGDGGWVVFPEHPAIAFDSYMGPGNTITVCGDGYETDAGMIARFILTGSSNVDEPLASNIKIFPQPATGILNLEWTTDAPVLSAAVCAMDGRQLLQFNQLETEGKASFQMPLTNMQAGTYILRLQGEDGVVSNRLFVKI